jgi:hypothetical protein
MVVVPPSPRRNEIIPNISKGNVEYSLRLATSAVDIGNRIIIGPYIKRKKYTKAFKLTNKLVREAWKIGF